MPRYIFITGGVVSSLGKGLASAALGALLQSRGYKVRLRKLDPYLNVDPGTMSPYQHGEVYVTDDGAETDLDLGHYERFTGVRTSRTKLKTLSAPMQVMWILCFAKSEAPLAISKVYLSLKRCVSSAKNNRVIIPVSFM